MDTTEEDDVVAVALYSPPPAKATFAKRFGDDTETALRAVVENFINTRRQQQ